MLKLSLNLLERVALALQNQVAPEERQQILDDVFDLLERAKLNPALEVRITDFNFVIDNNEYESVLESLTEEDWDEIIDDIAFETGYDEETVYEVLRAFLEKLYDIA